MADQILIPTGSGLSSPQALDSITVSAKEQQRVRLLDSSGNPIAGLASPPAGTERGLVTRPVASDLFTTGTVTAVAQSVSTPILGHAWVMYRTSGTWNGTLAFEATIDGSQWDAVNSIEVTGGTGAGTSMTSFNASVMLPVAGYVTFRVRASSWTSGTANVTLNTTSAPRQFNVGIQSVDTELSTARTPADSLSLVSCPDTGGPNYLYNGTTMDLERNDMEVALKASALVNAGVDQGSDITAHNAESLLLTINVTVVASGGTLAPALQGKDLVSGSYYTFWTAELPIKATGTYSYFFANGASGGDFTECQAFGLGPRIFRYQATVATAAVTYSVSAVLGDN